MATYDMTSSDTTGVSSNSIAALPSQTGMGAMRMVQAYLDIDALAADGYSGTTYIGRNYTHNNSSDWAHAVPSHLTMWEIK